MALDFQILQNLNKSPKIGGLDFNFVKKIQVFSGSSFRGLFLRKETYLF